MLMGHSRKHPYHPHGGNRKLTPLPPLDVLIHSLLSETNFFSPPPSDGRNFLCGGSMDLLWNDPIWNYVSKKYLKLFYLELQLSRVFVLIVSHKKPEYIMGNVLIQNTYV
jgi:hypothetical protein